MSDSVKSNNTEPTENNDQSTDTQTGFESKTLEVSLSPFGKLAVELDSESSGDELTAFDRERVFSDTDESDTEKKLQDAQAPSEPPTDPPASEPSSTTAATSEPRETVKSPENRQDETPVENETKEESDQPQPPSSSVTPPVSEPEIHSEDKILQTTDDQQDTSKNEEEKNLQVESERKSTSQERNSTQNKEGYAETEKGRKYPQNRNYSREKGSRWKNEDIYHDSQRERSKGRSYREDRGRREVSTSYGHDDRFYTNPDQWSKDPEVDSDMFQARPSPVRIWKGSRGRGGEGKWKHDKFNEDEQGPIDAEVNYYNDYSYSPPQSVGQSHYSEKKGRGRGDRRQQYDSQPPAPGFTRNSPRQERRGRGSKPRRDDYDRSSVNPRSKGRGSTSRYDSGYYNDNNDGIYLSKPIVFVSQNKRVQSPVERESTYNTKPSLSSSDIIRIGESDYIQSSASTPLPTIPVVSRTEFESDLRYSNDSGRSGQMKYGSYNNRVSERDSKPVTRSPYVGLGRGKGKFLTQVAILQSGQDRRKTNETAKLQYGKENISKNSLNEAFAHSTKSAVDSSAYKDEPQHKPQRYSTQRLKQGHSNSANTTATATAVVDPNSNFGSPIQNQLSSDSKQKSPQTQEQGRTVPMRLGERPQAEGHHPLMEVPYSEFYPSPFKEEIYGNQMSPMHPYNIMPDGTILQDFILPPEVMKEGSFQHMQFPPFMPQEMAMKGAPNMMGGPFMGNPQLGPEYMMGNEMPPNMQPELFMPMQSYYPPI